MRVSIKTFGCRLNQAEAARHAAELAALGWRVVAYGKPVDVVLIHACAVTQTAEAEVLRTARKLRATAFVALAGCVAPDALPRAKEAADLVIGNEQKENLAQVLTAAFARQQIFNPVNPVILSNITPAFTTSRAWLKIQDGCDFRCAYCIVPDTRGAPRSRPMDECLREAEALFNAGHRELVVTGCNIVCWREDNPRRAGTRALHLPDLLAALARVVPPNARLRLGSVEPGGHVREVIDVLAQTPVFCRFLHMPLQHADPGVLRAMRRRCGADECRALIDCALAKIPGVALGTDLITGFPGETEAAFGALREFIRGVPFANLHVFPFSERPGTPAATLPGAVPHALRKARCRELIALGAWQRAAFATRQLNVPQRALVERVNAGVGSGWTDTYLPCKMEGLSLPQRGQIVDFMPTRAEGGVLMQGFMVCFSKQPHRQQLQEMQQQKSKE